MNRIVEHSRGVNPFTREPMGPSNIEFFFPIEADKLPATRPVPPAFHDLLDVSANDASEIWTKRLGNAQSPSMVAFSDQLSGLSACSLVDSDDDWYLRFTETDDDYSFSKNFYFPVPVTSDQVAELLEEFDIGEEAFAEFLLLFAGLRTSFPGRAGNFSYDEFQAFEDNQWSENADEEEAEDWMDAICFYYAPDGDLILLNEEGQTATFLHDEGCIESYADTFDEFIAKYLQYGV